MARIKLTAGCIRDFTCPSGKAQSFLWDTGAPGLAVRATPGSTNRDDSKGKAYIFQGKLNGKDIRATIGDVRSWNLDDARAEARRLQTLIDQGTDPRQEKAERIAATEAKREDARRTAAPALEAWNAYLEARTPRWSARNLLDHQRLSAEGGEPKTRGRKSIKDTKKQPGILRPLLVLPLAQLSAERVRAWLADEAAKRPTQARIAFGNLRTFLNWCADRPEYAKEVQPDACAARVAREQLPKKAAKDDCLQREMLRPWFEQMRAISNPVHSAYLQALLLTGARREELAGLRWDDVDFQWRSMTIRDKVEGERVIPLTPYVAGLLRDLKARNDTPPPEYRILHGKRIANDLDAWEASPWVFSSKTSASGRLQEPRIPHNKALAAAGLPELTLHGLRRSFGTLAEWVECPAGISAQIMGHKPSAIAEKHYRRRPLDLLRQWHTKIEGWILEQAGIEQPTEQEAAPALRVVA
ncbi:tyrosine-type recombinase/integrase [Aromatoleum anaerobium]|uniref:Tyrosine-type recombinase/integrase n=1 Tax=Aromatoleum anaerobium TaxID=182180 RepID=A0ABX1PN44_9RHOO|nr:integrase family protein [Aromatoleum anaerobium]MCK0508556.1 integrase family protein [Aromatoleum anaerobium]